MAPFRPARYVWAVVRRLGHALVVVGLLGLVLQRRALACATCGCGDPTLTSVGVEKPYRNRLRVTVEERVGTQSMGAGDARSDLVMTRTLLGVSYTPLSRLTVAAFVPFVASHLHDRQHPGAWIRGLGDLELQARVVVARDRSFAPRHLLWLVGGVRLPTGPRAKDERGFPFPDDDQPGNGSWDPLAGATYAWFGGSVTLYSSLLLRYPTSGARPYRFGASLLSSSVAQLQPFSWLALQLGVDLRQSWADRLANDAASPNTGGFVVGLVPGALFNPWRDLLVRATVEVPTAQRLRGTQALGPQGVVSVSYDFL